jgi:hypothetical protein
VDVSDTGSGYAGISINTPGSGYTVGDVITVTSIDQSISDSFTINLVTTGSPNAWQFGTDGDLTLPTGGYIGPSGGKGLGTTYGGANDHLVSLTSYYDSGLYSSCVTAYADGTLNITAYNDGGPNPAKIWTFDNTGTLTLPDDSGIKSSTNIDITIDTPDSSTFNWRFGADGELTLPGGRTRIGTLLGSDAIIANEDTAFGVVTQGTNGSGVLLWIEDLENFGTSNLAAVYTNPANLGIVRIATGANGSPGPKFWDFNDSGALTFPQGTTIATADGTDAFIINGAVDKDVQIYTYSGETARGWTFGTDGSLQIPGDIKSNGNINIDINLSDSTLRRWQFGEDGALTFPDNTVQTTAYTGNTTATTPTNGIPSNFTLSTGNNTNLTPGNYSNILVEFTGKNITLGVQVSSEYNITIYGPLTASPATFVISDSAVIPGNLIGGATPADDLTITVDSLDLVAIDLTKTINKLTDGDYYLPDGVEGQVMYLVRQNGSIAANISVEVANARWDGLVYPDQLVVPFQIPFTDMVTIIFTDGAWQSSTFGS